ncbi:MAG: class I SAM-dependent methyltransferase [Firmicutes bacterium]|nr:class I SAM-dependent methyltransferase [Bacillota bacterium]
MDHLKQVGEYWDLRSHGFSDAINEELDSHLGEAWKKRFADMFDKGPLDVLDDGAGAGFFSMILASLGHNVTSIDYSDNMVAYIRENMAKRGLKANALQMDAQDLKFADGSFDAVVKRNVMWNLDAPEKAYAEIYRVLRPGGVFMIDDGNHYLSAHDEEYAKEAEARRAQFEAMRAKEDVTPGSHYRNNPENVDFTIIEKIAVEQPMSFRRRPQWDLDQMIRLGFKEIKVEIDGAGLPHRFLITAKKP